MRSTQPYDPRASRAPDASLAGQLGRRVLGLVRRTEGLLGTLGGAVLSVRTPGIAARRAVRRVLLAQILYTGNQAVLLIGAIGALLGATIVIQTELMVPAADSALIGKVLVAVVLRELAPLLTAIVVAGRSGTAIATELGNMQVNREIHALSALGIDPARFIVLPRLASAAVSVVVLMVYFTAISLLSTAALGLAVSSAGTESLLAGIRAAITPYDFVLFFGKGMGLGLLVGWLSCHYGLGVKSSPTEVPQMASRAVVMSLLGAVAFNTLTTAVFYVTVGPPLR
jgi:phospholipid/cholesterol/gamma-HCH transport system permease protein